jgi:hypothetical protein
MPNAKTKAETLAHLHEALHAWEKLGREEGHPIWLVEMINDNTGRIAENIAKIQAKPDNWRPRPLRYALAKRAKRG